MKGAGHDRDPEEYDRRDRYRYRQELVSRRRPGWTWGSRAPAEVVAWAGGSTARQYAALPDRLGGLGRCPSSQPPPQIAWPRCLADAGATIALAPVALCRGQTAYARASESGVQVSGKAIVV